MSVQVGFEGSKGPHYFFYLAENHDLKFSGTVSKFHDGHELTSETVSLPQLNAFLF